MRDTGCHWFAVGDGFKTKLAVRGPVALSNLDEAALLVTGHGHTRRVRVGKRLGLGRGTYVIKMVHQPRTTTRCGSSSTDAPRRRPHQPRSSPGSTDPGDVLRSGDGGN
jgi:hypothetical protein